jgi:hypothetical protein
VSRSLAKKISKLLDSSRKRRSGGPTFLVELYMMTQDRRSDFVIAAILVAIAAAPLLVFAGVIGSTAAYNGNGRPPPGLTLM